MVPVKRTSCWHLVLPLVTNHECHVRCSNSTSSASCVWYEVWLFYFTVLTLTLVHFISSSYRRFFLDCFHYVTLFAGYLLFFITIPSSSKQETDTKSTFRWINKRIKLEFPLTSGSFHVTISYFSLPSFLPSFYAVPIPILMPSRPPLCYPSFFFFWYVSISILSNTFLLVHEIS